MVFSFPSSLPPLPRPDLVMVPLGWMDGVDWEAFPFPIALPPLPRPGLLVVELYWHELGFWFLL